MANDIDAKYSHTPPANSFHFFHMGTDK